MQFKTGCEICGSGKDLMKFNDRSLCHRCHRFWQKYAEKVKKIAEIIGKGIKPSEF